MSTFWIVVVLIACLFFCMLVGLFVMWLFGIFIIGFRKLKNLKNIDKVEIKIHKKNTSEKKY